MEKIPVAISLDMDETLCSLVSPCIEKCRELWPHQQWRLPKYGKYSSWFNDFLNPEQREELYSVIKTEEFYMSLPPVLSPSHTNATLEQLSRSCWDRYEKVMIVTARVGFCPNPEEVTREWLRVNNFVDPDNVEIVTVDGSTSKTSVVSRSTLFVDDSLTVAKDVEESHSHHMILINHPWNDGYAKRSANIRVVPSRRMVEAVESFAEGYSERVSKL